MQIITICYNKKTLSISYKVVTSGLKQFSLIFVKYPFNVSLFLRVIIITYQNMIKQSLIIYKIPVLYNILSEIGENFEFSLYNFNEKNDFQKIDNKKYGNYIILTDLKNKITNKSNQLVFENFPTSIFKIVEKINILFLKQKFEYQSQISIGKYKLDLNSRKLINKEKSLKLTEKEADIIVFLNNSKESQSIENLQNKVWGHVSDLETHTVETHIYRLRKKLMDVFDGDKFIISTKEGYKIK